MDETRRNKANDTTLQQTQHTKRSPSTGSRAIGGAKASFDGASQV